jgi:hypothetical protein
MTFQTRVVLTENPADYQWPKRATEELVSSFCDVLGIQQIRELTTEVHRRPLGEHTTKTVVLAGQKITTEAQQASLKIIEEAPVGVQIVLVLPVGTSILPTVLSRVVVEVDARTTETVTFTDWLAQTHKQRLATIDANLKAKDADWIVALKLGLQNYVLSQKSGDVQVRKDCQFVLEQLETRGASNKMLLEHLALTLPLTR